MNRRKFLSAACATAARLATSGLSPSRKLFAQTAVAPNLISSCLDTHAQSIANFYNNIGGFDDLYAMGCWCF
jgi:hypothetical protein